MIDDKSVRGEYAPVFSIKKGFVYLNDKTGKLVNTIPQQYQLLNEHQLAAWLAGIGRGSRALSAIKRGITHHGVTLRKKKQLGRQPEVSKTKRGNMDKLLGKTAKKVSHKIDQSTTKLKKRNPQGIQRNFLQQLIL